MAATAAGVPTYTDWNQFTNQNQAAINMQDQAVAQGLAKDAKADPADPGTSTGSSGTPASGTPYQLAPVEPNDPSNTYGQNAPGMQVLPEGGYWVNGKPFLANGQPAQPSDIKPAFNAQGQSNPGVADPLTGTLPGAPLGFPGGTATPGTAATPASTAMAPQAFQTEWGLLASPEGFQQLAEKYNGGGGSVQSDMFNADLNPNAAKPYHYNDQTAGPDAEAFWAAQGGTIGPKHVAYTAPTATTDAAPTATQPSTQKPNPNKPLPPNKDAGGPDWSSFSG
jgi:hypothetical protein